MKKQLKYLLLALLVFPCLILFTACNCSKSNTDDGKSNPQTYTVQFDSNGGTAVSPITNVVSGSKIDAPEEPTKENYTFKGWYYKGEKWFFIGFTVTEDMTLVAKWEPILQYLPGE